jgi:hypothetical protein
VAAILLAVLLAVLLPLEVDAQLIRGNGGISSAVRNSALPLGVSQIVMAPGGVTPNTQNNGQTVPMFGASIAWSPTTTEAPRLIVGAPGATTTSAATGGNPTFGAIYVYDSTNLAFTLLQTLIPPSQTGAPALDSNSRFGINIVASQNSVTSAVMSGSNLYVSQTFSNVQARTDETIYFYSASTLTTGLTRILYQPVQQLRLSVPQTCNFGRSIALSRDDRAIIVGAPGYVSLSPSDPAFAFSGPTSGRAFVFQWQAAPIQAYTMQAVLVAAQAGPQFANEVGFGVAVAMAGNTFVVGSMGAGDVTGQLTQGLGNLYVFALQAPRAGTTGANSAFSTALFIQFLPSMPVSNAMSISMTGNYLCVGVQQRGQVIVMLNANANSPNSPPDYSRLRTTIGGTNALNTGMGQIVVAQMVDGLLYVYMGQPDALPNGIGAIFVSTSAQSVNMRDLGIQAGLEPGFGTAVAFNAAGNYMFAGNFLNNPHALVISLYFETLGRAAARQRLISNDVQTAGAGVFSNFGSVISGQTNAVGNSIVAVGASLGPTTQGRVFIYTRMAAARGSTNVPTFSLQAQILGDPGTNFGASIATLLSAGGDMAIAIGAASGRPNTPAYVDIYAAQGSTMQLLSSTQSVQRIMAPSCIPTASQITCGQNFGGSIALDPFSLIVAAHNFGVQSGTGRVYVYQVGGAGSSSQSFSLAQTLLSDVAEYGFGVTLTMVNVIQNSNTPPVANAQQTVVSVGSPPVQQTQVGILVVASMGQSRSVNPTPPFNQPTGVGAAYVYVRINNGAGGWSYSTLQVLQNTPVQLTNANVVGTGASTSMASQNQDLYIASVWRNQVRFYRYDGIRSYSLQQILTSPYGGSNIMTNFGCSIFATPTNRGLMIGAMGNGTVFMYLNVAPLNTAGTFNLIRVLQAAPSADMFGAAVTSTGADIVVGAPGANIATVYPMTAIMQLPAAAPSRQPSLSMAGATGRPSRLPTQPPQVIAGTRTRFPTMVSPTSPTPAGSSPRPTVVSPPWFQAQPTQLPTRGGGPLTAFPTAFNSAWQTTVNWQTQQDRKMFSWTTQTAPLDATFLVNPRGVAPPTPLPTPGRPSPSPVGQPTARPSPRRPSPRPLSKQEHKQEQKREQEKKLEQKQKTDFATASTEIKGGGRVLFYDAERGMGQVAFDFPAQAQAQAQSRELGSPPAPPPILPNLGYFGQTYQTTMGYAGAGSKLATSWHLNIAMALTGWGGPGQTITFYATKNNLPGMGVTLQCPFAVGGAPNGVPCTGQLVPLLTFEPPVGCSTAPADDRHDWVDVADNIDVSDYVANTMGGTLVLTFITSGVQPPFPLRGCQYASPVTNNQDIPVMVYYALRSVNPFPTFEPTLSVENLALVESSLHVLLGDSGIGAYVICLILGIILWCIAGFRLAIVRTNAVRDGLTPVSGFAACIYLGLLGASLLLDIGLAVVCVIAPLSDLHIYGYGMLVARLALLLPSIFIISKVYNKGSFLDQLHEDNFEDNALTYAFFSLFVLFDTQLLVYYPWRQTEFTKLSRGYPDFERLRFSTYPKLVSTVICLACQAALLVFVEHTYHHMAESTDEYYHDIAELLSFIEAALIFTVLVLVVQLWEQATHILLGKFKESKEDIADYFEKEEQKDNHDDAVSVRSSFGPAAVPHGMRRESLRNSIPPGMHPLHAPHMAPRASMGGGPPPPPPHGGSPRYQSGRFMPPGAIHPPMGAPAAPPARRASASTHFSMANPPPPMGGGRPVSMAPGAGAQRSMPQPRDVRRDL